MANITPVFAFTLKRKIFCMYPFMVILLPSKSFPPCRLSQTKMYLCTEIFYEMCEIMVRDVASRTYEKPINAM